MTRAVVPLSVLSAVLFILFPQSDVIGENNIVVCTVCNIVHTVPTVTSLMKAAVLLFVLSAVVVMLLL